MTRENIILIRKVKDEKFLGLYKRTDVFNDKPQDVFEMYWCDADGNAITKLDKPALKYEFDYDQAQSFLWTFAERYERGENDGLDIV